MCLLSSCLSFVHPWEGGGGGGGGKSRISQSVCLSVCLSFVHPSICLSVCPSAYLVVLPDQEGMELGEEGRLADELLCQRHLPSKSVGVPMNVGRRSLLTPISAALL